MQIRSETRKSSDGELITRHYLSMDVGTEYSFTTDRLWRLVTLCLNALKEHSMEPTYPIEHETGYYR